MTSVKLVVKVVVVEYKPVQNVKLKITITEQDDYKRISTLVLPEKLDAYYMRENLKVMVDEISYHPEMIGKILIEIETIK